MFYKLLLFFAVSAVNFITYSQSFDSIKNQEVVIDDDESILRLVNNLYSFVGDDFDSLDIELLTEGPVLGSILVSNETKDGKITYSNLYDSFLDLKAKPFYSQMKESRKGMKELARRPADYANWERDKILLTKIGLPEELMDEFELFLKENHNPSLTYENLINNFSEKVGKKIQEEREEKTKGIRDAFNSAERYSQAEILKRSRDENKPVLLYFTGFNCVNCRKIEESVLFEPEIAQLIQNEFILVPLYVDDRTPLPQKDQREISVHGRKRQMKTIGDENMILQITRFNICAQPHFVVINGKNELIKTADYNQNTIPLFRQFLEESIQQFEQ